MLLSSQRKPGESDIHVSESDAEASAWSEMGLFDHSQHEGRSSIGGQDPGDYHLNVRHHCRCLLSSASDTSRFGLCGTLLVTGEVNVVRRTVAVYLLEYLRDGRSTLFSM